MAIEARNGAGTEFGRKRRGRRRWQLSIGRCGVNDRRWCPRILDIVSGRRKRRRWSIGTCSSSRRRRTIALLRRRRIVAVVVIVVVARRIAIGRFLRRRLGGRGFFGRRHDGFIQFLQKSQIFQFLQQSFNADFGLVQTRRRLLFLGRLHLVGIVIVRATTTAAAR